MLLDYNAALGLAKLIDFEDMLSKTRSMLALPAVRDFVRKQYTHILVDEFQVRWLMLLARKSHANLLRCKNMLPTSVTLLSMPHVQHRCKLYDPPTHPTNAMQALMQQDMCGP